MEGSVGAGSIDRSEAGTLFADAGLSAKAGLAWMRKAPAFRAGFTRDAAAAAKYLRTGAVFLSRLPPKAKRTRAQQAAAEAIQRNCRNLRERFLARHAATVYRKLTRNLEKFLRVDELSYAAAKLVPGLTPTREEVEAESRRVQSEKDGVEIDQGIFLAQVLAVPEIGMHLCEAMLRPRHEAVARVKEFIERGVADLGPARVERQGKAAVVTLRNPRYLNAEDEGTLDETEIAVDIALLDPLSEICVFRGDVVDHPKYRGRRIFCAGINLTHLYRGKISYLWYIRRDMGIVNKMMRGLSLTDSQGADEIYGGTREKPWIAEVDAFAIGGGCQYLLAMDYVVAGSDAYMTLPARKEGIIPGAANLRLPRFVGDRIARQAILMGRRLDCDTPEGRMICDLIVPPAETERAVARVVEEFTGSGVVSAAGNRRALRVGEEPLDLFRRYMAVYCREQAYCHFSPALIANLERHWNAAQRKI